MTDAVIPSKFNLLAEAPRQEYEPDRRLPTWARRSHPIVRRHLGAQFKVATPDMEFVLRLVAWQVVIVLLSFPIPFVLELVMLGIIASAAYLPIAGVAYFRSLFFIITASVNAISEEQKDDALSVLRTVPISLRHILLGKITAGIWKQAETLELIWITVGILSLPAVLIHYALTWPPDQSIELLRVLSLIGLVMSILRSILEPVMAGALGILAASLMPIRVPATTVAAIVLAAYFVLTNLIRMLPLPWGMWLIMELVMPLALPLLVTWGALKIAEHTLCKD